MSTDATLQPVTMSAPDAGGLIATGLDDRMRNSEPGRELGLREKFERAAGKLLNLRITTVLGDATVSLDESRNLRLDGLSAASTFVTNINLLEGDIWTSTSQTVPADQLSAMRDYHHQMVERAQQVVERNLALLRELMKTVDG